LFVLITIFLDFVYNVRQRVYEILKSVDDRHDNIRVLIHLIEMIFFISTEKNDELNLILHFAIDKVDDLFGEFSTCDGKQISTDILSTEILIELIKILDSGKLCEADVLQDPVIDCILQIVNSLINPNEVVVKWQTVFLNISEYFGVKVILLTCEILPQVHLSRLDLLLVSFVLDLLY
jgi:hypothetical protein